MQFVKGLIAVVSLFVATATLGGCDNGPTYHRVSTQTQRQTQAQGSTTLANAEDFDLETVIGLVTSSNTTPKPADLEKVINDPDKKINNVNLDGDDYIDPITVVETQTGLEFQANPTKDTSQPAVTVASITVTKNVSTNTVDVSGGYPDYMAGGVYYNRPGLSLGQALFLSYLWAPHPLFVPMYHPGMYGMYHPMPMSQVTTARSTYRTTTHIAPIPKQTARPSTYNAPKASPAAAQRIQSMKATARPTGSVSGNASQQKSFNQSSPQRSAPPASNSFRRPSSNSGSASSPAPRSSPSPSRSFSAPSRSSGSFGGRRR